MKGAIRLPRRDDQKEGHQQSRRQQQQPSGLSPLRLCVFACADELDRSLQPVAQHNQSFSAPDEKRGNQRGNIALLHEKEDKAKAGQQCEGEKKLIPGPLLIPGPPEKPQRQHN